MTEYMRLSREEEIKLHKIVNLAIVVLTSLFVYMVIITAPIVKGSIRSTIESNLSPNIDQLIERNIPSIIQMAKKGRLPG